MSLLGVCGVERRVRHVMWPLEGEGNDSGDWEVICCPGRIMGVVSVGWRMMYVYIGLSLFARFLGSD